MGSIKRMPGNRPESAVTLLLETQASLPADLPPQALMTACFTHIRNAATDHFDGLTAESEINAVAGIAIALIMSHVEIARRTGDIPNDAVMAARKGVLLELIETIAGDLFQDMPEGGIKPKPKPKKGPV